MHAGSMLGFAGSIRLLLVFILCLHVLMGHVDAALHYVDSSASGKNTGRSWIDAFTDLQDGLRRAGNGDSVLVAQGIYYPASPDGTRDATFYVRPGVSLIGGYAHGGGTRNVTTCTTILSGDIFRDDKFDADTLINDTNNVFHVVMSEGIESVLIDGVTIQGGYARGFDKNGKKVTGSGGGLYIRIWNGTNTAGLILKNSRVTCNTSRGQGAGLFFKGSTCVVQDCTFDRNYTTGLDDGARYLGGVPILSHILPRSIVPNLKRTGQSREAGLLTKVNIL